VRVTIEDVAREAGVSIATVSRFMNGRPGAMSEATRERLHSVIERLGYVPNPAAQTLKTGRSRLVGVVLSNIAHPYWSGVLAGVEDACQRLNYSVVIGSASDSAEAEHQYVGLFLKQHVDGLLLNPASADAKMMARWSVLTCPVIMLDRTFPGLSFPLVAMDNRTASRMAVEHLVELGHRRIGMVSWRIDSLSNRHERLTGYQEALGDTGIEPAPDLVRFARESWDDGVRETLALFGRADRPTAVFSATGALNLQVLAALKQLGLRVPDDVSVVGYDDSPWDPLLDPPLTTVSSSSRQLGATAAELLCAAIEDRASAVPLETRLPPRLTLRGSTSPPSPQHDVVAQRFHARDGVTA